MGLLGGIKKIAGGVFKGIKKFAGSTLGQNILGFIGSTFGGPIGNTLAKTVGRLLSGQKFNFKDLIKNGLGAFGGLTGKFGLTDLVKNLPTTLKNPINLLSSLKGKGLPGLSDVFSKLGLGQKFSNIIGKASGFLGQVGGFGSKANNILNAATNLFNKIGIKTPPFLGNISEKLNSILATINKVQDILGQFNNITAGATSTMLRA
jgi:hypothetical protein